MLTVYNCVVAKHDLRLVALAGIICLLASWSAITLFDHVRRSSGLTRRIWLVVAAAAAGFGIWATHFVAMLAFEPALPTGYELQRTLLPSSRPSPSRDSAWRSAASGNRAPLHGSAAS